MVDVHEARRRGEGGKRRRGEGEKEADVSVHIVFSPMLIDERCLLFWSPTTSDHIPSNPRLVL